MDRYNKYVATRLYRTGFLDINSIDYARSNDDRDVNRYF
jgi:hypothetical protein